MQDKIKLSDIHCPVKGRIKKCQQEIEEFMTSLGLLLEYDENPCASKHFICRSSDTAYEDDGNTPTPGYSYTAYWCYQLNPKVKIDPYAITNGQNIWQEECLYFSFQDEERIRDHHSPERSSHFFSLYICRVDLHNGESHVEKIAHNNNNYALTSIINNQNVVTSALEIKALAQRRRLLARLEDI